MFLRLFAAFALIPVLEIYLLIKVGSLLGAEVTIALVLASALAGAWLARQQGLGVMLRIRESMARGAAPAEEMVDALLILVAGVLLLTPGFITDTAGMALLVPPVRGRIKAALRRALEDWVRRGQVRVVRFP
ncbi:FxsA family protein [Desulfocurvus vexinensis]|uniref:FxsA family protein n=1 Tax=Desulfocurvus vexinensis TaxID=399548 RepID=UPI000490C16D|nr:FxsA family protein [Desulfocurvus vexinensis]